ncbi:hypothetical protein KHA93_05600 [Bacillus sp. FJAT-49732]|uniref:Uncharacterized protein n=1 Tax=Lederbergia citrisecunda TaxID=2833583 RepID=A0A942YKD4_9BACI|nr:hypothetical protein [Lederbergia citrisecunda]MBS4199129.1 hypothetical protein [Lederbergia citrisecunda]
MRAIRLRNDPANKQLDRKIIIMCWPYDIDESAYDLVKELNQDDLLIYIGDNDYFTGTSQFFNGVEWLNEVDHSKIYNNFGDVVKSYQESILHERP